MLVCFGLAFLAARKYTGGFPMHFNLKGEFSSFAPSWVPYLYPIAICAARIIFRLLDIALKSFIAKKPIREIYAALAALAVSLFATCSLCVGLTGGSHVFMFLEPAIVLGFTALILYCETSVKE